MVPFLSLLSNINSFSQIINPKTGFKEKGLQSQGEEWTPKN